MAKQEMRDKTDDHESVQGQGFVSSRVPTFSVILGVVSLGIIGLSVAVIMAPGIVGMAIASGMGMGATVFGVVGLVLGLIGIRPIYAKRGRAVTGIILCAVSVIIGIGTAVFSLYSVFHVRWN